jgi:hypothetical protein
VPRSVLHGSMHEVISDISRGKRRTGGGEGEGEGEGEWEEGNIVELGGNDNCTKTTVNHARSHQRKLAVIPTSSS